MASGQSWDPGLEIEVPFEQRPVNEYSFLKESTLYSWAELGPGSFFLRLGGLWLVTSTVLASWECLLQRQASIYQRLLIQFLVFQFLHLFSEATRGNTFLTKQDPLRFFLAPGTGTLFLVSLIVLRIYLRWSYVGDRILSAVIPYEETGWYDGQMWVKPPEILARDIDCWDHIRYKMDKVKPVIKLLKQTLVGTGVLLVIAVSLFIFVTPVEHFIHKTFVQENQSNGSVSKINSKFNIRKEELLRLPVDVKTDDDLAANAAEAAEGRPVYCRDRFYRALAGGQYYRWEDLLKRVRENKFNHDQDKLGNVDFQVL